MGSCLHLGSAPAAIDAIAWEVLGLFSAVTSVGST